MSSFGVVGIMLLFVLLIVVVLVLISCVRVVKQAQVIITTLRDNEEKKRT